MLPSRCYCNSSIPLASGARDVAYGDLGTSLHYSIREGFHGPHTIALNGPFGVLSLVFRSIIAIMSIQYYVIRILKVDNGERDIFALLGLYGPEGSSIHTKNEGSYSWDFVPRSSQGS